SRTHFALSSFFFSCYCAHRDLHSFPTRRSSDLILGGGSNMLLTKDLNCLVIHVALKGIEIVSQNENNVLVKASAGENWHQFVLRSEEHTSELQSRENLVCRLLLEKKKKP